MYLCICTFATKLYSIQSCWWLQTLEIYCWLGKQRHWLWILILATKTTKEFTHWRWTSTIFSGECLPILNGDRVSPNIRILKGDIEIAPSRGDSAPEAARSAWRPNKGTSEAATTIPMDASQRKNTAANLVLTCRGGCWQWKRKKLTQRGPN